MSAAESASKAMVSSSSKKYSVKKETTKYSLHESIEAIVQCHISEKGSTLRISSLVNQARLQTVKKIRCLPRARPLHYISRSLVDNTLRRPEDVMWNHPRPEVLYRICYPENSASAAQCRNASSLLALFFIDDVFLHYSSKSAQDSVCELDFRFTPFELTLPVLRAMREYALKGFRIVLLDHLPSLHFGSSVHVFRALDSLSQSINDLLGVSTFEITILLSIVSNISCDSQLIPFCFPNTGLFDFFQKELNMSLQVDRDASIIFGSQNRQNSVLNRVHTMFAKSISLPFNDVSALTEI